MSGLSVVATPGWAAGWLSAGDGRGLRVLLIEDDYAIAEMYRRQLELDGMSVSVATDGPSGLAGIRNGRWDVVLLDIRLPRMDGLDVLRHLGGAFNQGPPVLILSNYGESSMIRDGLALGAADYLVKSATTPAALSARVRAAAGQPGPGGIA